MNNESYRVERVLKILTYIMIIVIILTSLTFFNIIDPRKSGSRYCIFSDNFECDNLVVRPLAIEFDLKYNGADIRDILITTSTASCSTFSKDIMNKNTPAVKVSLSCAMTSQKTKTYKDTIIIRYRTETQINPIEEIALIKAKVE
jgi:hypothetical protein